MRSSSLKNHSCPNSPLIKKSYRLVVFGSTQTGKTSVLNRFLNDEFSDRYIPTIENFYRKTYKVKGELYQLDILDTSGNDPFPAARRLSFLSGDMFLLVCSVETPASYDEVFNLREQILDCKQSRNSEAKVPIVIFLNKIDVEQSRQHVNIDRAREQTSKLKDCGFLTGSAKRGDGVNEIFAKLFAAAKLPKHMNPYLHRPLQAEMSADAAIDRSKNPKWPLIRLRSRINNNPEEPGTSQDEGPRRMSLRKDLFLMRVRNARRSFGAPSRSPTRLHDQGRSKSVKDATEKKCVIM